MSEVVVGAREFRARLGRYLRLAREGGTVTVTQRGVPVGRLAPIATEHQRELERSLALVQAGLLEWSGKPLRPLDPPAKLMGPGKTMADRVSEGRD